MKATAELQVLPIGSGVSVRKDIVRVIELLQKFDFVIETHAWGTDIEGDMADILSAVALIHETLHNEGSVRLVSILKLGTRTDKTPTLVGKQL